MTSSPSWCFIANGPIGRGVSGSRAAAQPPAGGADRTVASTTPSAALGRAAGTSRGGPSVLPPHARTNPRPQRLTLGITRNKPFHPIPPLAHAGIRTACSRPDSFMVARSCSREHILPVAVEAVATCSRAFYTFHTFLQGR